MEVLDNLIGELTHSPLALTKHDPPPSDTTGVKKIEDSPVLQMPTITTTPITPSSTSTSTSTTTNPNAHQVTSKKVITQKITPSSSTPPPSASLPKLPSSTSTSQQDGPSSSSSSFSSSFSSSALSKTTSKPTPSLVIPSINEPSTLMDSPGAMDFANLLGQLDTLSSLVQAQSSSSTPPTASSSSATTTTTSSEKRPSLNSTPLPSSPSSSSSSSSSFSPNGPSKTAILTSYFMENLSKTANVPMSDKDEEESHFENLLLDCSLSKIKANASTLSKTDASNSEIVESKDKPSSSFTPPQLNLTNDIVKSEWSSKEKEKEKGIEQQEEMETFVCPGCHQTLQLGDTYIEALDQRWHETHLQCCVCQFTLTNVFFEDQGQVYCEHHYLEKTLPKCGFCNELIKNRCVQALNQTFHPEHFFCSQCGVPFNDTKYRTFEGKAYCEVDYMAFFAPLCAACTKPIASSILQALNKTFHLECFVCTDCKKPFRNNVFFPLDQLPYCEFHFHKRNGTLCPSCDKPISGKFMEALGKKWHIEHFVCQSCETMLNKVPFKDISGKPYCVPCYNRFFV